MKSIYIYAHDPSGDRMYPCKPGLEKIDVEDLKKVLAFSKKERQQDAHTEALDGKYDWDTNTAIDWALEHKRSELEKLIFGKKSNGFSVFGDDCFIAGFGRTVKEAKLKYYEEYEGLSE